MEGRITVLLVDDHPMVREGIRTMLANEDDIEVLGEASTGEEALTKVDEFQPQVVLMDVRLPGMSGTDATRAIKKAHPTTSVIVVTMYDNEMYVIEALRAGAAGYLTKDASRELLCHSVRAVVGGGTMVRSGLLRHAIEGLMRSPRDSRDDGDTSPVGHLSPRELEVLSLLAQGQGNRAICAELNLAEVTVKKYVQSVIGKLGVSDRTQAAIVGVRLGLAQ